MTGRADEIEALMLLSKKKYRSLIEKFKYISLGNISISIICYLFEAASILKEHKLAKDLFDLSQRYISDEKDKNGYLLNLCVSYAVSDINRHRVDCIKELTNNIKDERIKEIAISSISQNIKSINRDLEGYCVQQVINSNICKRLVEQDPRFNTNILVKQNLLRGRMYEIHPEEHRVNTQEKDELRKIVQNNKRESGERLKHNVIMSCDIKYAKIFFHVVRNIIEKNQDVKLILIICVKRRSDHNFLFVESNKYLWDGAVEVYTVMPPANMLKSELKTFSATVRYELMPLFLERDKRDLMVMDIDLNVDELNIADMMEQTNKDQIINKDCILTYCSRGVDYQSRISAGMLYASLTQIDFYWTVSDILSKARVANKLSWGLDQASLILAMSIHKLNPLMIPYLAGVSSDDKLWNVSESDQALKLWMQ